MTKATVLRRSLATVAAMTKRLEVRWVEASATGSHRDSMVNVRRCYDAVLRLAQLTERMRGEEGQSGLAPCSIVGLLSFCSPFVPLPWQWDVLRTLTEPGRAEGHGRRAWVLTLPSKA